MIISEETYVEHFGVKGMQWGKRKKRDASGLSRTRRAALERNAKFVKLHEQVRDRTGSRTQRALTAPDRLLMGKKRFEKAHNKRIDKLKAQSKRIEEGNLFIRDRLDLMNQPLSKIFLERKS